MKALPDVDNSEATLEVLRALSALLKLREEANTLPMSTICGHTYTSSANEIWAWAQSALADHPQAPRGASK